MVGSQWSPHRKQGEAPPNETPVEGGGVSETDLYLLGAIEKLAKRVERLESRLMRTEETLCYLFGRRAVDWKSANSECRKAGAVLAEFESTEEGSYVLSTIVERTDLRGAEYWTGGLNPGLLWIWSHGGRPVSAPLTTETPQGTPVVGGDKGGRCLKLAFKPSSAVRYAYEGSECAARLRFVCEDGGPDGEGAAGNALRRWRAGEV
ncbi:hypothetical protein J437_LFUL013009 [Ladona fulva]|uniref:C-type lectin domain-containing protein n=1 Tax=Ladona fulva TaxID=123851 RepID=A0A8K0KN66_LADFU|nr:hypothetical protein J437_LFUL013009 [Ladona fulva]